MTFFQIKKDKDVHSPAKIGKQNREAGGNRRSASLDTPRSASHNEPLAADSTPVKKKILSTKVKQLLAVAKSQRAAISSRLAKTGQSSTSGQGAHSVGGTLQSATSSSSTTPAAPVVSSSAPRTAYQASIDRMRTTRVINLPPICIPLFSDPSLEASNTRDSRIKSASVWELVRKTVENTRAVYKHAKTGEQMNPSIEMWEEIAEVLLEIYPKLEYCFAPKPVPPHVSFKYSQY